MSRLDRFLVSVDWEEPFRGVAQVKLRKPVSDHWPILLNLEDEDWGPKTFRFNNACLNHKDFLGKVKEWWPSFEVEGWARF